MARFTFKLPDIGEGISEAEIVAWHVALGDHVKEDHSLADMMTDKATVEIESPVSGIIVELAGEVGDRVAIGAALVVIEVADEAAINTSEAEPSGETSRSETMAAEAVEAQAREENRPIAEMGTKSAPEPSSSAERKRPPALEEPATPVSGHPSSSSVVGRTAVSASPAVRRRAQDLGVDLAQLKGDSDRIRHSDLDAFLRYGSGQGYHAPGASRSRPDETIKVIGMRRRIAENMAASKRNIPHFTYVDEIDVTELERVRANLNDNRGNRPKLTLLPLLIVAICRTLPDFPMLNARYDDEAGVVKRSGRVHLGMATQTDAGLTVPVIRDAQDRNVWQLATEIARLAEAARGNRLKPSEMGDGTITLTSLGPLGGIATTPVINRPEVAIIGPNKIVERPVFDGDDIRRAKLMNLSISCDHRVVDGWDAASYVQTLKRFLETPVLLFAE